MITTYQTLNSDFVIPSDIESDEEKEWLIDNGFADPILLSVNRPNKMYIPVDYWPVQSGFEWSSTKRNSFETGSH